MISYFLSWRRGRRKGRRRRRKRGRGGRGGGGEGEREEEERKQARIFHNILEYLSKKKVSGSFPWVRA